MHWHGEWSRVGQSTSAAICYKAPWWHRLPLTPPTCKWMESMCKVAAIWHKDIPALVCALCRNMATNHLRWEMKRYP